MGATPDAWGLAKYGRKQNQSRGTILRSSVKKTHQGHSERLAEKDRQRFEDTFLPYLDAAFSLARWIIQHDQDAQDVVQEAYIRAFKAFDHFRGGNSKAWFLTIVRHTAYNWYNKHAREPDLIPYEEDKHADIVSINEQQYRQQTQGQTKDLRRALERLPLEFREVIILYELEGLSYRELATALEIPVGTVMSRLSRARRRLREELSYGT
jgi:RNA polymerase sigma-70 factor (ECF subfamily)